MLPLEGVRVIAVEQYGAGPYGTLHLASLGAEVIKIERPDGGDFSRQVGPEFVSGMSDDQSSLFFQALNHNKRSLALDLEAEEGRARLRRLAAESDGLITNLRGDVVDKLGLNYASLADANERLVCAHITAYGRTGPRAHWPGYDYIMQAECGYFALTGEPDGPPSRFGLSVVDFQAGVTMAMALLAGILNARARGKGGDFDISLFDVALHNLNYIAMWQMNSDHEARRAPRSAHLSVTPCQLFKTADGWIYVMCNKEKFWRKLCAFLQRPELLEDPRFENYPQRLRNRDALTEELDRAFAAKTTDQWLALFDGAVPASRINSVSAALDNPFLAETGRIVEASAPDGQRLRFLRCPVQGDAPLTYRVAPRLGGDGDDPA